MSDDTHQNDRLLSIETALRDMASQTGQMVVKQELMNIAVEKGFGDSRQAQESLNQKTDSLDKRLVPFEVAAAKRASRVALGKKFMIAALIASAGVFGTVAGDNIVMFVGKLIGK